MIRFLLIFIFYSNSLFGEVIINNDTKKIDNFSLQYYYDKSKDLDINRIQKITFDKNISNRFAFGYIKGNSWFKLRVTNNSQNEDFILRLNEPFFQEVNLFEKSKNSWQTQRSGLSIYLKNENKKDIHPIFFLKIRPNSSKIFYIQINSQASNFGKFELYSYKSFILRDDFSLYWFYFGTMIIVILFNLFLFFILKDRLYIYYVGYIFFHTIFIFLFSGLSFYNIKLALYSNQLEISIPLYILFLTLFSNNFFKTKLYLPLIDKILKIFVIILK